MIPLQDSIPRRHPPVATISLIALNALFFTIELSLPKDALEAVFYHFGIVPARFTCGLWGKDALLTANSLLVFLTSMFLHGGWVHLISNMWALWLFGDNVEDKMGSLRFVAFYLICGIAAGIVHVCVHSQSTLPTIGASGAIAGVLGAYLLMFPHSQIVVMLPILFWPVFYVVPAVVYLGIWAVSQLFNGMLSLAAGGMIGQVAWWAHLGGFLAGVVLHRLFVQRRRLYRRYWIDEFYPRNAWRISQF